MKKFLRSILAILFSVSMSLGVLALAQAGTSMAFTMGVAPIAISTATCPAPAAGTWSLCPVGSGSSYQTYVSYNGGAYAALAAATTISFSQISGQLTGAQMPATTTCTLVASISSPNTITLSGCK